MKGKSLSFKAGRVSPRVLQMHRVPRDLMLTECLSPWQDAKWERKDVGPFCAHKDPQLGSTAPAQQLSQWVAPLQPHPLVPRAKQRVVMAICNEVLAHCREGQPRLRN